MAEEIIKVEKEPMLTPAKKLAYDLSEIDKKFNAAFEALFGTKYLDNRL